MSTDTESETGRIGRRALVRAGATAAWAVPVVAMAAPAHAAACSGGNATLTAVVVPNSRVRVPGGSPILSVQVVLSDTGQGATCALSATATALNGSKRLLALSVDDWPPVATDAAGTQSLTVSAPATAELAAGASRTSLVTFQLKDGGVHDVTVTFRSSNGGLATISVNTQ